MGNNIDELLTSLSAFCKTEFRVRWLIDATVANRRAEARKAPPVEVLSVLPLDNEPGSRFKKPMLVKETLAQCLEP